MSTLGSRAPTTRIPIGGGLALLTFGIVFGLVAVETVPRLLPRLMPKGFRGLERVYTGRAKWEAMMVADPYLGYRPRPGLDLLYPSEGRTIPIRTTSLGFGDIGFRDIGTHPPFDLITLGDSFAFCDDVPVEECWVRRLADSTGLSVATLGVSGYSTLAEARILERYGRRLRPRVVLLGLFPNDFNDNLDFDEWVHNGGSDFWSWRGEKEGRGEVGHWLAEHSIAYRIADGALRGRNDKTYRYKKDDLDFVFRVDRWWLAPGEGDRARERERGWQLMQKALLDMRAAAADIGAEFVVVLIPSKEEVYWDIVRPRMPGADNEAVDHPLDVVRDFCQEHAIPYCELRDALQTEARRGRQVYLRVSGHWNGAGNAVAGSAIRECLAANGLLHVGTDGQPVAAAAPPQ